MDERERIRLAQKRRRRRARQRLRLGLVLLFVAALVLLFVLLLRGCAEDEPAAPVAVQTETVHAAASQTRPAEAEQTEPPETTEPPQTEPAAPETSEHAPEDESWKLILVNATHPLPEGYTVTLKQLRNDHYVDERIYPELQQMFDDARAAGVYPLINESYRTTERQQQILDSYIADYEAEGLSHDEAEKKALEYVALPGTSEHELGLALDIIAEYEDDSSATWQWLLENSWRYGFILRYPADKVEITGIAYEPWHFRYVGAEAAQEITEQGLCLEEFLDNQATGTGQ